MKKLNNKGFTLIELLAVVVILAVVMGIAMTSVLSAMNKSRGGSLADTASVIAQAFNQKYTESLVDGVPTNVYGDVLTSGYNFSTSGIYFIDKSLADTFNISANGYALADAHGAVPADAAVTNSFISYNSSTGKFVACMVANTTGSYFVDSYKVTADTAISAIKTPSTDITFNTIKVASGNMIACSDGSKSW